VHYFAAVVVPPSTSFEDIEKHVTVAMKPWDENAEVEQITDEDGETYLTNPRGKWDWWQIGGRWTGVWSDYDPNLDLNNIETCSLCGGSGTRPDAQRFEAANPGWLEWSGGCNGCQGKGAAVKWPTSWASHEGDLLPVSALLDNPDYRRPHALVIPEGGFFEREWYVPADTPGEIGRFEEQSDEEWEAKLRELLEPLRNCSLAVVDFHT
jgi:hypothetical protein